MIVLKFGFYTFGQSNLGGSTGLSGQVTKLQLEGVTFYTRETLGGINSFLISSDQRMGDKIGKKPSRSRQALELCAPGEQWQEIADLVKETDPHHRPVLKNKRFTAEWAEKILSEY